MFLASLCAGGWPLSWVEDPPQPQERKLETCSVQHLENRFPLPSPAAVRYEPLDVNTLGSQLGCALGSGGRRAYSMCIYFLAHSSL